MAFLYWLIADKIIIAPNKVARKYIYAPFCVPDKCHEKHVSAPQVPSLNNPEVAVGQTWLISLALLAVWLCSGDEKWLLNSELSGADTGFFKNSRAKSTIYRL